MIQNSEFPVGLKESVRQAIMPLLQAAKKSGWIIHWIHWLHEDQRIIVIQSTSPSGNPLTPTFDEARMVEQLTLFFNTNRTAYERSLS